VSEKQYLIDAITVDESWRLFKILAEFVDGFETLSDIFPCVSIFGSSQVRPGDEHYENAVLIARQLAQNGFNIMT
jgi:predicted Rossmann-fold nucleotide-binding protein